MAVWWCSFAENYIPLIMKNKEYTHLRAQVQKVEEKILTMTGKNVEFNMEWTRSQRNEEYSIFEYRLSPSFDFQQKLLSMGNSVGVLAPVALKDILRKKAEKTANNNASAGMGSQYHFKVYKK